MTEFFGVAAENLNSDLIDWFFSLSEILCKEKKIL